MGPLHPTLITAASRHVAKLAQGTPLPMPSVSNVTSMASKALSRPPPSFANTRPPSLPMSPGQVPASGVSTLANSSLSRQSGGTSLNLGATPIGSGNIVPSGNISPPAPMRPPPLPVPR